MKTNAKLFPVAPAFASQMPDTFPALAFTAANGAVFWPARPEDLFRSDSVRSARRSAGAGSIYAVDDDEDLTDLYTILLEARGYTVKAFHDRAESLAAL